MQRFWAKEISAGKPYSETLDSTLHLTQVSLDAKANSDQRTSVQLTFEDQKITLGSLSLGKNEQFNLDVVLDEGANVTFEVIGPNKVSLVGYYIIFEDFDGEDESDDESFIADENELDDTLDSIHESEEDLSGDDLENLEDMEDASPVKAQPVKKTPAKSNDNKEDAPKTPSNDTKKRKNEAVEKSPVNANDAKKPKQEKQTPKQSPQENKPQKSPQEKPVAKSPEARKTSNGLVIQDITLGNGPVVPKKSKISVKYIGRLTNGKVFDSALSKPFSFKFAAGEVIKGWDLGIEGMRVGGKRKLIIPPQLGYGGQRAGSIPPNSTLEFEVELIRIN